MKKRISLLTCFVFLLIFSFTGCGKKEEKVEYDQKAMENYANILIQNFSNMPGEELDKFGEMSELQLGMVLQQANLPIQSDDFISMIEAWKAGTEECGKFVEAKNYKIETSSSGPILTTDAKFKDRQAEILFGFDKKMSLTSITVNAQYSVAEVLKKAGLNTILGMGTVFIVLIFISFIISLFKFIPAIERKFGKSKVVPDKASIQSLKEEVLLEDDADRQNSGELAAVIAGAIAAMEGTSADGFIVRSIKRRKTNKWS